MKPLAVYPRRLWSGTLANREVDRGFGTRGFYLKFYYGFLVRYGIK